MSCAYWAPKSTTSTGRGSVTPSSRLLRPDPLGLLQRLALGLDRRGHDDLGLLELPDGGVAGRGHRCPKAYEEVEGPVVLVGRPDQDLLQGTDPPGGDPGSPRQVGMERGHPP